MGLKINLAKCQLFGIGVPSANVESVARSINSSFSFLPFTYLRLPVGKDMRKIEAPNAAISRLESIRRRFLWGMNEGEKKMFWVGWNKVMLDKEDREQHKSCSVADRWAFSNGAWATNWAWRRQPTGRSLGDISSILNLINGLIFDSSKEDEWVWNIESSCKFSVSSLCSLIQKQMLVTCVDSPKFVWNSWVPRKVNTSNRAPKNRFSWANWILRPNELLDS
ncbi:hypothetical protein CTI12_AA505050 [Artemisia annua]|uniref:RNA-directed DNA polymerase, eukaryota, Reverse transcriptase zinc-binding domain protein n=1 Tax=Artemisia annua TaxID=35608 RepID=A0A2U1LCX1_ARTAN|nr:hypothetical protein CTI12_AA505050 [Artemisia annua]